MEVTKTSHSKKSILPEWNHKTYTKYVSPMYDFLTSMTGWRRKLAFHGLDNLSEGELLDVGCGTGYFMHLAQRKGLKVQGIEPSTGMVEKARSRYGFDSEEIIVQTAEKLPYADQQFDVVVSNGCLVHISDIQPVVNEMIRVLKPGGLIRVIDHATPVKKSINYPLVFLFSQFSGDIIHDYPRLFAESCTLVNQKTLGRGGYLQRFDFRKNDF